MAFTQTEASPDLKRGLGGPREFRTNGVGGPSVHEPTDLGSLLFVRSRNAVAETGQMRERTPTPQRLAASIPYVTVIRSLLEREEIPAARRLLAFALQQAGTGGELGVLAKLLAAPRITRLVGVRDTDRSAEFRVLAQRAGELHGHWVAVTDGDVVASARALKDLLATLKTMHLPRAPLVHRID
jgi:hypothetical protein